jgi:DNA-directed RNA polymerase subunit omega
VSGVAPAPEGITNPPIDELLERTSSKYGLVIFAAKRARQINAYYSQLSRACWSTSARWSTPPRRRSRSRSPCARSTRVC